MNYPAASGRGIPLRRTAFRIAASVGEWNPKRKFNALVGYDEIGPIVRGHVNTMDMVIVEPLHGTVLNRSLDLARDDGAVSTRLEQSRRVPASE